MTDLASMSGMPEILSADRKRLILIVDDEEINREILSANLEEGFEIITADTGGEAIAKIQENIETLSLVLLDLILPDTHGLDILRRMKQDRQMASIPVIVLTSDREAEVESLNSGASDFIPKPYPMPEIIQARIRRTIELSENRDLIRWTERDHLTGLYNRDYFYRYAEQYDLFHKVEATDAVVVNVKHFRMINGLIRDLDHYVWREAAAQIRDWKARLGRAVPVSVNVSRIDMMDPDLTDTVGDLVKEFGLEPADLHLEITESAYTQDAERIVSVVESLRGMGFVIEMDDFGSGYSSLNMISTLPIDALKLDMQFIRNAFSENGNTRIIEITLDISRFLNVPMIAEGVETEEQMLALKKMGCDIVQGYYFSRPLPAEEFESFLTAGKTDG